VRAVNSSQAIGHVVKGTYVAFVPTQDELVTLISNGFTVEVASAKVEPV